MSAQNEKAGPWHCPACNCHNARQILKCLRCDLARPELYGLPPLNSEVQFILGQPCFVLARTAEVLRRMGFVIAQRAEAEQAAVLHWELSLYGEFGMAWHTIGGRRIAAAAQLWECA